MKDLMKKAMTDLAVNNQVSSYQIKRGDFAQDKIGVIVSIVAC